MPGLIWSGPADADLKRVEAWLAAERPPSFELKMLTAIHARCALLARSPGSGATFKGERRKAVITGTPYIAIYRLEGDEVEILRLFHERQDWQSML